MRSSLVSGERWRILRVSSPPLDLKFPPANDGVTLAVVAGSPFRDVAGHIVDSIGTTILSPDTYFGPTRTRLSAPSKLAAFASMSVPQGNRRPSGPVRLLPILVLLAAGDPAIWRTHKHRTNPSRRPENWDSIEFHDNCRRKTPHVSSSPSLDWNVLFEVLDLDDQSEGPSQLP